MQLGQPSAKIYQFPTARRAIHGAMGADARFADLHAAEAPVVDFGCSYHGAAVEEDAASRRPSAEIRPFARH